MTAKDLKLADEMAKDILDCMKFDGQGDGQDLSDEDVVREIVDSYIDTETEPTKDNFNSNFTIPGVWTFWTPSCRYNVDFPGFDKALKLKTDLKGPAWGSDKSEEEFYTFKNCKKIYDALNPIYKQAKKIVFDRIMKDPSCIEESF